MSDFRVTVKELKKMEQAQLSEEVIELFKKFNEPKHIKTRHKKNPNQTKRINVINSKFKKKSKKTPKTHTNNSRPKQTEIKSTSKQANKPIKSNEIIVKTGSIKKHCEKSKCSFITVNKSRENASNSFITSSTVSSRKNRSNYSKVGNINNSNKKDTYNLAGELKARNIEYNHDWNENGEPGWNDKNAYNLRAGLKHLRELREEGWRD